MKTASVGEIQKNFSRILKEIKAGEEIAVTRRGKPTLISRINSERFDNFSRKDGTCPHENARLSP